MSTKITGKIASDDKAVTATFDASPWFSSAAEDDIRLLFRFELPGGFLGQCDTADEVAYTCLDQNGVSRVMNYVDDNQPKPGAGAKCAQGRAAPIIGFEVTVNRYEALTWLMHNRRTLWSELFADIREDIADRASTAAPRVVAVAG